MVLEYLVTFWDSAEPRTYCGRSGHDKTQIYTDWANHYLEKARSKRYISDLQQDVTDGVLLADVIEAVTNEKLQDIKCKPKNSTQMIENITSCLTFLGNLGVNLDGITAKDIKDGNLKAILGLFFSLSRYKQQQKSQQQQQKQEQQRAHQGETTDHQGNKTGTQAGGEETQSRLPAYGKQQGGKCPTIAHPSSKEGGHRSKAQGTTARARQQNLQNNNQTAVAEADPSTAVHRATSPGGSSIPTPGGRGVAQHSQSATPEKSQSRLHQSSTPTPSSQNKTPSQKSSIPTNKQNSMLDKFKLFNSKEKAKTRSGLTKASAKPNSTGSTSTSTLSASSRSDTSSSISPRSSSSVDTGATSSATSTNDLETSKLYKPRPLGGGISGPNRDHLGGLTIGQQQSRQGAPSPYSSSLPSTPTSSLPASHGRKTAIKAHRGDVQRGGHDSSKLPYPSGSQTLGRGATKGGSLIPKTGTKTHLTSASSESRQLQNLSSSAPTGTGVPHPGSLLASTASSSAKPPSASGKSSKSSREDKMKGSGAKDHGKSSSGSSAHVGDAQGHYGSLRKSSKLSPGTQQNNATAGNVQAQSQHSAHSRLPQNASHPQAPPIPPHRNGSQLSEKTDSSPRQQHTKAQTPTTVASIKKSNDGSKTRYTEIEYTDGRIERVGEGHFSKPANQAVPVSHNTTETGMRTPSEKDPAHHYLITSQSVNVVKPTCSTSPHSSTPTKPDCDKPTTLPVHNRSAQPPPLPKTEPPPSTRTNINNANTVQTVQSAQSTLGEQKDKHVTISSPEKSDAISVTRQDSNQDHSTSSSTSSTESIILNLSAANSPRLGVKVLGSQVTRPANNVAIVQPHHGEKKETTFEAEVHTNVISKEKEKDKTDTNNIKDTSSSEKFVADSGETLNIQPMKPIPSTVHYGTGFMRSPYASPAKQMPMSVSQNQCYAMTGVSLGNRIGMNRSLIEAGKYYASPMKRAMSGGSGSVSMDEYSSDYDPYDYISGYMSDGDILKGNKSDDMNSGYMSESGASLYARRLQQRFREGMQAVKECMQKSSGVTDEDSFDDSSSISSGDISDTINEISTDEGNLTGGSGPNDANPYNSLKRGPKDLFRNITNANLHASPKRVPNLGTSAFLGVDYASDSGGAGRTNAGGWPRKYSLQNNRLLSSDPADYAYLYSGYQQWPHGNSGNGPPPTQEGLGQLQKLANTSQPEMHYRSHSTGGDYAGSEKGYPATKCDSETNTDQSHVHDERLRKMQQLQNARQAQAQTGYGYARRPVSNTSTGSAGSTKSAPSGQSTNTASQGTAPTKVASAAIGSRLAKHGLEQAAQHYHSATSKQRREKSAAAQAEQAASNQKERTPVMEYSTASLERRTKCTSAAQTDMDIFKSNSLGRRKGHIGSRIPPPGENSTIISNPHATFSRPDGSRHNSPYSSVHIPGNAGNYVPLEFAMGGLRNSGNNWIRNNGGVVTADGRQIYHHVSDSESMDALTPASSIQARIQQARALSGASARILQQSQTYGLQRSNSMRSTQSETYASPQHLQQNMEDLPSPPPPSSPTPSNSSYASSRFTYPMTTYAGTPVVNAAVSQPMVRSNTSSSLPYNSPLALSKINREDEDSLHGSALSLVSSSSSVYSTAEEKHNQEMRKLRRELESAHEKVSTLTNQLTTNAHVVAAFEQSLSNMTHRLQHLTCTAEQKDSELNDLRATIEALKRQSGLSIQEPVSNGGSNHGNSGVRRHTTPGMLGKDLNAHHSQGGRVFHTLPMPNEGRQISRQISSDSMSSINSMSSACSVTSQQSAATEGDIGRKKKKKGWLRSSFTKAFAAKKKGRHGSLSDCEPDYGSLRSTASVPNSPLLQVQNGSHILVKGSHSSGALSEGEDSIMIMELRKQLRDKDMKLTDIRLEALSSAHQLEQLRETMNKMKNDMGALKSDNDRLHRMVHSTQTLTTSQSSLLHHGRTGSESLERTISLSDNTSLADLLIQTESSDRGEGRRVPITVYLGSNPDPNRARLDKAAEVPIGSLAVSGKTKWEILDNIIRKIFKEYVLRIDPVTNLGLSAESVYSYHIGDIKRTKESEVPELLPVGYLVGDTMQIGICLKGTRQNSVDSLAFETLIPKSIVQRYISLLLEHRRIILCGPSGTGKTYLAQKLAEHLVLRSGKELTAGSVATFNVDHKSAKDLRQYLANIADQCENTSMGELPSVIILDNLHHVGSLGEVFNGFLSVKYQKCPYIIGTMNQATCSTTNLQLHHNFRWVLCANHMEPVKGFLGRYLRRRLVEAEVMTSLRNNDLNKIIDWVPKVWSHLNKFLETHSSSDVTIGPRLFLSAPMDITESRIWFTDLWNYSVVPYMLEAVREGLQVYGRRAQWEDPSDWVLESFPWIPAKDENVLLKMRPEDVGYDSIGVSLDNNSPKVPLKDKEDIIVNDSETDSMISDV